MIIIEINNRVFVNSFTFLKRVLSLINKIYSSRNGWIAVIYAIKVENLHKSYGNVAVLKGLSFEVKKGEIFALLGANGSGKTTTLECIEEIRKYDIGSISVDGSFGVQLQSTTLPKNIKVIEALTLFSKWNSESIDQQFLQRIGLHAIKNKKYVELSTGQKRKLHLALALVGNPDILFLDEPTAGLDVEGRAALHDEIKMLKEQGKTIMIASHDMAEVETLCDSIAILKGGKIAFIGALEELIRKDHHPTYEIRLKLSGEISFDTISTCSYKGKDQGYHVFEANNVEDSLLEVLTFVKKVNIQVLDIKLKQANLEQRFLEIVKEGK